MLLFFIHQVTDDVLEKVPMNTLIPYFQLFSEQNVFYGMSLFPLLEWEILVMTLVYTNQLPSVSADVDALRRGHFVSISYRSLGQRKRNADDPYELRL